MVLGILTIVATHAAVRVLVPAAPSRAVFAAAVVAFNPMFVFVTAAVNNDAFVIAAAAALVFATSRSAYDPARVGTAAATGAAIGLATLGKLSALVLVPPVLYRIAVAPGDRRGKARATAALVAAFGAVAGWWFLRLRALAADPVVDAGTLAANLRPTLQPLALLREWDGFVKSFWGVFGAFNVIFSDAVYEAFFALSALGLGAIVVAFVRGPARRDPRVRALAILTLTNLAAVAVWTSRLLGSQGRLMFPSLAAIATLAAMSLDALRPSLRRLVTVVVPAALALAALFAGARLIPAAYPPL